MNRSMYKLKGLSTILSLLLLTTALLPISSFAEELPTTTATITVEKKISGDIPPSAEKFAFTLTPDDENYPMPEGTDGNTITIQGEGTASFSEITFSEPDTYTYTVSETQGNALNYTYDKTVYKATVYVTTDDAGELTATVWMTKDDTDGKSANAVFTNSYKLPEDPYHPITGAITNITLWIVLAGGSAATLLYLIFNKKRKKESTDSNK